MPIGYDRHPDPKSQTLVVNPREAETVNTLFRLYGDLGCQRRVTEEAARLDLHSKRRVYASGRESGGQPFSRGRSTDPAPRSLFTGRFRDKTSDLLTPPDLPEMISSGRLEKDRLHVNLSARVLARHHDSAKENLASEAIAVVTPIALRRRGVEMKIVAGPFEPQPDPVLLLTLAPAHRWIRALRAGTPLSDLARQEKFPPPISGPAPSLRSFPPQSSRPSATAASRPN